MQLFTEPQRDDDESEFETLSLSDLPLYGDDDHGHEERHGTPQNDEEFEFSASQELTSLNTAAAAATTSTFPQDNIVFCGKLIGYKEPNLIGKEYTAPAIIEHGDIAGETKKHYWRLFRWNFGSRRNVTKDGVKSLNDKVQGSKSQKKRLGRRERYGFSRHKVSILTSSSSGKAKWYFFLFGISSFSTKIELRDLKNRLERISSDRSPSRVSPAFGLREYKDEESVACKERSNRGWGLLELIKTLNCGWS